MIADLEARRDEVLGSLERLSSELSGTATQHAKAIAERAADTAAKAKDERRRLPGGCRARGARATSTRRRRCLRANPPHRLAVWLRPGLRRESDGTAVGLTPPPVNLRRLRGCPVGRTRAASRKDRGAGQASGARAGRAPRRPWLVLGGGAPRQLGEGGTRGRRRGDRPRRHRRAHGRADGQRPDREGGLVGTEDGREDPSHPGASAATRGPDGLSRGLGRGPDNRPGPDVPRPPRRGSHLPQRGGDVRAGAAGLPALRAVGRGRAPTSRRSATS